MKLLFWRHHDSPGIAQARAERLAAEYRLRQAQEHVIGPLEKLREDNHIGALIEALIMRKAEQSRGDQGERQ